MKHKEPQFVIDWRQTKPPKCCHTCESYLPNGECRQFRSIPPQEFCDSVDVCESWEMEIRF
jgi:hypothetical protein